MVENLKTKHTFYYFCLLFRSRDIFCRGRFYSRLGFSFSARLLLLYERGADCRVSCPLMGRPEVNCQSCSSSGCNLLTLVAELWGAICFKIVITHHSKGIENQISFIIQLKLFSYLSLSEIEVLSLGKFSTLVLLEKINWLKT